MAHEAGPARKGHGLVRELQYFSGLFCEAASVGIARPGTHASSSAMSKPKFLKQEVGCSVSQNHVWDSQVSRAPKSFSFVAIRWRKLSGFSTSKRSMCGLRRNSTRSSSPNSAPMRAGQRFAPPSFMLWWFLALPGGSHAFAARVTGITLLSALLKGASTAKSLSQASEQSL